MSDGFQRWECADCLCVRRVRRGRYTPVGVCCPSGHFTDDEMLVCASRMECEVCLNRRVEERGRLSFADPADARGAVSLAELQSGLVLPEP